MRQIFGNISWEKKATVFFTLVTLTAFIGPFGTYNNLEFFDRLVFWVAITAGVGFFIHIAIGVALASKWLGGSSRYLRVVIGSAVGAIPGAAVVMFVFRVYFPVPDSPQYYPAIWAQVFLICIVIGLVEYIDWREKVPGKSGPTRTRFHKRLPEALGDDIISLSMQDHYAEVTTVQGKHLVLIRLGDAIDELAGLDGLKIHRSHWVATRHFLGVKKTGAKSVARLSNGQELPVSGSCLEAATRAVAAE